MESNAILWVARSANPTPNPGSGELFMYVVGNSVRIKNSAGQVDTLSTGITQDEVEDFFGGLLDGNGGQGIDVNYDDAGGLITVAIDSPTWTLIQDALQPSDNVSQLTNDSDYQSGAQVDASITAATSVVVPNGRQISTTAPLPGGGDLSADRTLSLTTSRCNAWHLHKCKFDS
jgi:hypothetical protein